MATTTSLDVKMHNAYMPFSINMERAHEIPKTCTQLAKILAEQPLFEGTGSPVKRCKVIALSDWDDVKICDIFSANSRAILGNMRGWHIHDFSRGKYPLFDSRGELIEQGISLWLYDEYERCSYEDLQESYDRVFSAMINGWKRADFKDYPDIMYPADPEKFDLFIKDKSLGAEFVLIGHIAEKLSLSEHIGCNDIWFAHPGYSRDKIYLWIRKTELENVVKKIGLKLDHK